MLVYSLNIDGQSQTFGGLHYNFQKRTLNKVHHTGLFGPSIRRPLHGNKSDESDVNWFSIVLSSFLTSTIAKIKQTLHNFLILQRFLNHSLLLAIGTIQDGHWAALKPH